jgi:hypothetical protein
LTQNNINVFEWNDMRTTTLSENYDWLTQNNINVFEWNDMRTTALSEN